MDETLYDECYIASVDGVHHYLIISDYGESADFTSMIFEYGNGEIVNVGKVLAHARWLEVNTDGIVAPEEIYHLQCQPVKIRYKLKKGE